MSSPLRTTLIVPIIVGCAQFMHQFDGAVIATALPAMAKSLGEEPLRLNFAITCYLLALAVFVPISGWMADRFGARRIFTSAIVLFTVSSVLCGLAHSLPELVLWRTLQGIGGAMMTPVGRVIVVKSVPKSHLVSAMNYITIPAVLGPVLGPPVGGFIVTYFSWPWIFYINLPIGLLGVLLSYIFIPEIREETVPTLDLRGFALVGMALAALVFGFEAMGRGLLPVPLVVAILVVGAICGALYVVHARRKPQPIIDLALMRVQTFAASVTGGSLFYIGTTSQVFLLALLLQVGFGFTPFQSGLTSLASAAGAVVMRFTFTRILHIFGFRPLLVGQALLVGVTLIACGFFTPGTPYLVILLVLVACGYVRSMQFSAVQSLAYADLRPGMMSPAVSFSAMVQQVAQSFGVGVVAVVVHLSLAWHGRAALIAQDVAPGYFVIGICSLASIIIFLRLPARAGSELVGRR